MWIDYFLQHLPTVFKRKTPRWEIYFDFYLFPFYTFLISYLFYTYKCIYIHPNLPIHPTTTPTPCFTPQCPYICSLHLSLFLPGKPVHLNHFSRFHIYALIYDISFSLSNLLHSVWQSLGPSTSLQMTQFHSFLWLSNIPLYICTTTPLSIHLPVSI